MWSKIKKVIKNPYYLLAASALALAGYTLYKYQKNQQCIKLSAFLQALSSNQLNQVQIVGQNVYFKSQISNWYYTKLGSYPISLLFQQLRQTPNLTFSCQNDKTAILGALLAFAASLSSFAMVFKFMAPDKLGTINKKAGIVHNKECFQDFFGSEDLKMRLKQLVSYLKNKEKFAKLGGRLRKGILLYGPPGTGKTMLAKTLANQANIPFIQTCASQFQQIYVGVGPKKIRQIFQRANQCSQGCIIFIDELDAIGSRSSGMRFSKQTTATINQLLIQLDGFQQNEKVVVIGATNRIDLVDQALIRAGRFDLKINLHLPNQIQRLGILKTILRKKKVPHAINQSKLKQISVKSQKWNGADIQTLINQSIYCAIRKNLDQVNDEQIQTAFNQLIKK